MSTITRLSVSFLALLAAASLAAAATVTLDMNGFPDVPGGQVTGLGLAEAIKMKPFEQKVALPGLKPGETYHVDFFHNTGKGSSDFDFVVNDAGTGVQSVGLGGEMHHMVVGFKPGDATLKMKTFPVTLNANNAMTETYYVMGAQEPNKTPRDAGPQTIPLVPGTYAWDNLTNCGHEDFRFIVDDQGKVGPAENDMIGKDNLPVVSPLSSLEYAEFTGSAVKPRAALVHLRIEAPAPVNFNPTYPATAAKVEGTVYDCDMVMAIGSGGVNVWTFGQNHIEKSDALGPNGKTLEGVTRDNDFYFYPRLRYDLAKKEYYFVSTSGPAQSVSGQASGEDDNKNPLGSVKVIMTIVKGGVTAAATQPGAPAPAK